MHVSLDTIIFDKLLDISTDVIRKWQCINGNKIGTINNIL